jgi:hypothetical protein
MQCVAPPRIAGSGVAWSAASGHKPAASMLRSSSTSPLLAAWYRQRRWVVGLGMCTRPAGTECTRSNCDSPCASVSRGERGDCGGDGDSDGWDADGSATGGTEGAVAMCARARGRQCAALRPNDHAQPRT